MKKEFKELKDLQLKGIVELYESSNLEDTKSVTGSNIPYRILKLSWNNDQPELLIQYPDSPHFLEIPRARGSSSCGNTIHVNFSNPFYKNILDENDRVEDLYIQRPNAMLKNDCLYHNFLTTISRIVTDPYSKLEDINPTLLIDIIEHGYYECVPKIQVPEYVMNIEHITEIPFDYLLITHDKYVYSYDTMRAFFCKLNGSHKQLKVEKFNRMRDGGTTRIKLGCGYGLDDQKYEFYSPTPFKPELKCSLDGWEIDRIDKNTELVEKVMKSVIF